MIVHAIALRPLDGLKGPAASAGQAYLKLSTGFRARRSGLGCKQPKSDDIQGLNNWTGALGYT